MTSMLKWLNADGRLRREASPLRVGSDLLRSTFVMSVVGLLACGSDGGGREIDALIETVAEVETSVEAETVAEVETVAEIVDTTPEVEPDTAPDVEVFAGCDIEGVAVPVGALRPESSCEACRPERSTSAWTSFDDGEPCDQGTCILGTCKAGPTIVSASTECLPNDGQLLALRVDDFALDGSTVRVEAAGGLGGVVTDATINSDGELVVRVPAFPGFAGNTTVSVRNAYGATATWPLELHYPYAVAVARQASPAKVLRFAVGDVDGDARADVVWVANDVLHVARGGRHDGTFEHVEPINLTEGLMVSSAVAIGDVDGDGIADVVGFSDRGAQVFNGVAGALPVVAASSDTGARNVSGAALGDFDGDGDLDLAVGRGPGPLIDVYNNDGSGAFTPDGSAPIASSDVLAADLRGDGFTDLIAMETGATAVVVSQADAAGFTPASRLSIAEPQSIEIADFDDDGRGDLLLTSVDGVISTRVYRNDGFGGFGQFAQLTGGGHTGASSGDFNGDGARDVITSGGQGLRLISGRGDATFTCSYELPLAEAPQIWRAADIDGDGNIDAIGANPSFASLWIVMSTPPQR